MHYTGFGSIEKLAATALPVKAARIAVPEEAGRVDPLHFLRPHEAEQFADWAGRELPDAYSQPAVRACHRVAATEEGPSYRRLAAAGMGRLHSEEAVREARATARGRRVDPTEPLDVGGLFAVRHRPDKDRLIYDRRPRNSRETKVQLGQATVGLAMDANGAAA